MERKIGLLLGAGFSFELGMPLVSHLTAELKGYLTPDHFRELNAGWKKQKGGFEDSIIETLISLLAREDMSYEAVLGFLQTNYQRHDQPFADQYYQLYTRLVELVYLLLYRRQAGSLSYIQQALPPYEGMVEFARQSAPLWVFSLNHDVMLELIVQHCNIPFRDGFWSDKKISILNKKHVKDNQQTLFADVLTESDINSGNLNFLKVEEDGINILKLHGALNVFAFRNGFDLCRLNNLDQDLDGYLKPLRVINDETALKCDRVINEIVYLDIDGEIQFLRRTLLAGAQKFDKRFSQTLPQRMLDLFKAYINYVEDLYIIGYGFGDAHVDSTVRNWLEFSANRSVIIVNPYIENIPHSFSHLAPQITILKKSAAGFFTDYRSVPLSMQQLEEWKLRNERREASEVAGAKKWP